MVKPSAFKGRDTGRYKVRYKGRCNVRYKDLCYLSRQPFIFKQPPIKARRRKPRVLLAHKRPMLWLRRRRFLKPSGNILQPGILLPRVRIPDESDYTEPQLYRRRCPHNPEFPTGTYTLLLMNLQQMSDAGCMCPQLAFSSRTGDALVGCDCTETPSGADVADYPGEYDEDQLDLKDEVRLRYFTPKPSALRARRTDRPPLTIIAVCTFPHNTRDDGAAYLRENEQQRLFAMKDEVIVRYLIPKPTVLQVRRKVRLPLFVLIVDEFA